MSEEAQFVQTPSYPEKKVRKSHFVTIFFIILFLVILILIGLYFLGAYKKGSFNPSVVIKPTATPIPTTEPTPSPTPVALKRDELTINILNGSGVAGAAKETSTLLKNLGYTIKTVGNAKQFDYTGITILITKEKEMYLEQLKKDLADSGKIVTEIDNDLAVDAEVIVGK